MGAAEFRAWEIYLDSPDRMNLPHREDHLFAMIAHLLYLMPASFFGTKNAGSLLKPADFLMKFERREEKPEVSEEAILQRARAQEAAMISAVQQMAAQTQKQARPSIKKGRGK